MSSYVVDLRIPYTKQSIDQWSSGNTGGRSETLIRCLNALMFSCGCLCLHIRSPWFTTIPSITATNRHPEPNRHSEGSSSPSVCAKRQSFPCGQGVSLVIDRHKRVLRNLSSRSSRFERVVKAMVRVCSGVISLS